MSAQLLDRRNKILKGNLMNVIITLSLPVVINNFIIAFYNMIDALFISSRGALSLSSVTYIDPITSFFYAISLGLTVAATAIIARKIGEGNLVLAKKNIVQTMFLVITTGLIICVLGILFSYNILKLLGATDNIIHIGLQYFKLQMMIIPLKFIGDLYLGVKRAEGNTFRAMVVNSISMLIKVISNYILIDCLGLGVTALGYSTLIAFSFLALVAIYEIFIKNSDFKVNISDIKFDRRVLYPLLIISLPLIVEKTSLSFSNIIVSMYTVHYSETVIAAYGLTNKINSILFTTSTGFGIGLVAIISQNLGNHNVERAKRAIKITFLLSSMLTLIMLGIVFYFQSPIIRFFTKDDIEFYKQTKNAMDVYTSSVIPWAIFQIVVGVFQGSGHTTYSLIISIFRMYFFRIPVIYYLMYYTNLQEYSIWYGMLIANWLTAIFAIILYLTVKWEKTPKIFTRKD